MKLIIAGSRKIPSFNLNFPSDWQTTPVEVYNLLSQLIKDSKINVELVISGGAWGMDKLGEKWAINNNKPIERFIPDWNKFGKKAGILRNIEMAKTGDALVCICTEDSRGSNHMIETMSSLLKPVFFKYV